MAETSGSKRKRDADEEDMVESDDDKGGFIDDDSEPHRFGISVLPVAKLPNSFEGVPQDGMEYLFTVRREERRLPIVTRVPNPYAVSETNQRRSGMNGDGATNPSMNVIPSEEWRTCFEERFRNLRANLRQATIHISLPLPSGTCRVPEKRDRDRWWAFFRGDVEWEHVPTSYFHGSQRRKQDEQKQEILDYEEPLPQEGKMRGWVVYEEKLSWDRPDEGGAVELSYGQDINIEAVEGEGEVQDGEDGEDGEEIAPPPLRDSLSPGSAVSNKPAVPGDGNSPREPTPHMLSILDQKTIIHLLKYFSQWIQGHFDHSFLPPPPPLPPSHPNSPSHETRSYDLTSCHGRWIFSLLSRLDAQLTSNEISALRTLARECIKLIKEERSLQSTRSQKFPEAPCVGQSTYWMIVAAVAGIWGQKDLWLDAANMLQ